MAVVVPLVMAAAGATATTIALTSIALAVTGISGKINKAATKVFGEDLVKVANIAGSMYLAFGGGFSGGGEAAAGAADGLGGVVDATGGIETAIEMANNGGTSLAGGYASAYGADAVVDATGGVETAVEAANNAVRPQAGAQLYGRDAALEARQAPGSGAARAGGSTPGAGGAKGVFESAGGSLGKAKDWFSALPERTQAAVIQAGGELVMGAAGGYARGKQVEDEREARKNHGSGTRLQRRHGVFQQPGG